MKRKASSPAEKSGTEQEWHEIAKALVAIPSEAELEFFKQHVWDAPRRVTNQEKNKIDAIAEESSDLDEYRYSRVLSRGARRLLKNKFPAKPAAREIVRKQLYSMIDSLFDDRKIRSSRSNAKKEERITKLTRQIDKALRELFGVFRSAHRPVTKEDQHREWSRLRYLGRSYKEIADGPGYDNGDAVSEDHIQKSVVRYRKRREPVQWALRYAIYHERT